MSEICGINPYEIYKKLQCDGIIFCFAGPLSHGVLVEVGDVLKAKLEADASDQLRVNKVFSVFVEQMQNIFSHSDEVLVEGRGELEAEVRQGLLVVGQEAGSFYVLSGNYVLNEDVDDLKEQLEKLRQMDKDEMKAYFKEMRRRDREGAKGAGIGFIETARRASLPLEYEITKVDGQRSFFHLKAVV